MVEDMKQILLKAALSSDPPLMTDDPIVNHMVDCHMTDEHVPFNANQYLQEIDAWKKTGGYLLKYEKG